MSKETAPQYTFSRSPSFDPTSGRCKLGTMVRFLKLVEPALQILPEVAMPERKVS